MNRVERTGCESILRRIQQDDLMLLKDTVTKRQVAAENVDDAIQAILTYSESSTELLRRKKIRREVVFQYLADQNVPISVNAEKHQLIQKTLAYWGASINSGAPQLQLPGSELNQNTSACQTDNTCKSFGTQSHDAGIGPSMGGEAGSLVPVRQDYQPGEHQYDHTAESGQLQAGQSHHPVPTPVPLHQEQNHPVLVSQTSHNTICANSEHQKLGETFVSWFYRILNSHNPSMNLTPEDFSPQHFWNDVRLHLLTMSASVSTELFEGGVLVSDRLLALVREEQLLFNPNVTCDGINIRSDRHGLLIIMVCGTIHRGNDCLGVFQQMFGLIGDPRFDNNWKIKVTKLRIESMKVTSVPRLVDSDNSDMLSVVLASNGLGT